MQEHHLSDQMPDEILILSNEGFQTGVRCSISRINSVFMPVIAFVSG